MQRQASNYRAALEPPQDSQPRSSSLFSPRIKMDETTDLPLYYRNSGESKRGIPRSGKQMQEKLVHLIPVVVILCFFILWWFSYPVNLERKNGIIIAATRVMTQDILAFHLTDPPFSLITEMKMMGNDSMA